MPRYPGWIAGSYQSLARNQNAERTVNLYMERSESEGSASRAMLFKVPGLASVGTASGGPGRGHFYEAGREFAVEGTSFVEIAEDGTVTSRGTVAADSNPATICSNGDGGNQLLITSGTNAYSFDLGTNTLTQIAALNGLATMGAFLDGYGIVLNATTSIFYISALLDFTTWSTGTDFAQRSQAPDPWKAMNVNGRYIALLGEKSSEFWYDSGATSFPFAPHPSGLIPTGIAAPFSLARGAGVLYWLAQDDVGQRFVVAASGFTPEPLSDFPQQRAVNEYAMVDDAQADVINWNGHTFYVITFPDADVTRAFDHSANYWFEWRTWISEENDFAAWRPRWHVVAFGQHRILDSETGDIYYLDADTHTDVDGRELVCERTGPPMTAQGAPLFMARWELAIGRGVGTSSGQGPNPRAMFQYSWNAGATWSAERWMNMGAQGVYDQRCYVEQLGSGFAFVPRVRVSDPVPVAIIDGYYELAQRPRGNLVVGG